MGNQAKIVFSATDQTKAAVASFKRGLTDLEGSAARLAGVNLGASLGAALTVAGVTAFTRNIINGLDALNDLKDATGASIENISALEDIAARTGTPFEAMSSTLIKFNNVLKDADAGSAFANTLKKLGLDAEELRRIDPAEALRQTAVALSGFADDGSRARIVAQLFGKSVAEIAPYLKDLSEQGQLVAKVTTEQAQAAEDFNKALSNLEKNATDAARTLLADFVPAMASVLKTFNDQGFRAGLDDFGERVFGWTSNQQRKEIKRVQGEIEDLRDEFEKWDGVPAQQKRVTAAIDANVQKLADLNRAYLKISDGSAGGGRGAINPEQVKPAIGAAPEADKPTKRSALETYIDQLEKAQLTVNELTEVEKAMYALQTGELGKVNAAQREYLLLLARGVDLSKEKGDLRGPTIDPQLLEARNALEREVNSILANRPTNILRQEIAIEQELNKLRKAGTITLKEYQEALETAFPEMRSFYSELNTLSREAASDIEATLGGNVRDALQSDFDGILRSWEDMLLNMAAKAAQAELSRQLFGSYTSGGNLGGYIGQLLGGADAGSGPSLGGPTIGGGAEGGYVVPSMAGSGRMSAMSAAPSVVIYQTNQIGDHVTPGQVDNMIRAANAKAKAELMRTLEQRS